MEIYDDVREMMVCKIIAVVTSTNSRSYSSDCSNGSLSATDSIIFGSSISSESWTYISKSPIGNNSLPPSSQNFLSELDFPTSSDLYVQLKIFIETGEIDPTNLWKIFREIEKNHKESKPKILVQLKQQIVEKLGVNLENVVKSIQKNRGILKYKDLKSCFELLRKIVSVFPRSEKELENTIKLSLLDKAKSILEAYVVQILNAKEDEDKKGLGKAFKILLFLFDSHKNTKKVMSEIKKQAESLDASSSWERLKFTQDMIDCMSKLEVANKERPLDRAINQVIHTVLIDYQDQLIAQDATLLNPCLFRDMSVFFKDGGSVSKSLKQLFYDLVMPTYSVAKRITLKQFYDLIKEDMEAIESCLSELFLKDPLHYISLLKKVCTAFLRQSVLLNQDALVPVLYQTICPDKYAEYVKDLVVGPLLKNTEIFETQIVPQVCSHKVLGVSLVWIMLRRGEEGGIPREIEAIQKTILNEGADLLSLLVGKDGKPLYEGYIPNGIKYGPFRDVFREDDVENSKKVKQALKTGRVLSKDRFDFGLYPVNSLPFPLTEFIKWMPSVTDVDQLAPFVLSSDELKSYHMIVDKHFFSQALLSSCGMNSDGTSEEIVNELKGQWALRSMSDKDRLSGLDKRSSFSVIVSAPNTGKGILDQDGNIYDKASYSVDIFDDEIDLGLSEKNKHHRDLVLTELRSRFFENAKSGMDRARKMFEDAPSKGLEMDLQYEIFKGFVDFLKDYLLIQQKLYRGYGKRFFEDKTASNIWAGMVGSFTYRIIMSDLPDEEEALKKLCDQVITDEHIRKQVKEKKGADLKQELANKMFEGLKMSMKSFGAALLNANLYRDFLDHQNTDPSAAEICALTMCEKTLMSFATSEGLWQKSFGPYGGEV